MNAMACVYPKLTVFEIEWQKFKPQFQNTSLDILNKIYLYIDCLKRIEENDPNEYKIKNLFNKAVKYYNKKVERLANNVGSKGARIH